MEHQPFTRSGPREPFRVLLLGDAPLEDHGSIEAVLQEEFGQVDVKAVTDRAAFDQHLHAADFSAVISLHPLAWSDPLEIVRAIKVPRSDCPVVLFAQGGDAEIVSEAMKRGLDDYLTRSADNLGELAMAMRAAVDRIDCQKDSVARLRTRMRGLLSRLNVGVFRTTREGRVLEANPALLGLLAVSPRQIDEGIDLVQVFLNPAEHDAMIERLAQGERQIQKEVELLPFDGKPIWVSLTIAPASSGVHEDGYEGMIEDVTARRLAETSLELEQATNQALFDALPDTIWRLSADGTFIDVKPGPGEREGQPSPAVGERFEDVFSPELAQRFFRTAERAARTHEIQLLEYPVEGDEGVQHYEARLVTLEKGDLLAIVRNITARHQAEEQQAHSQEQLRSLADHLQSVREEERTRIAAQIHDELGQALTALKLDVCWLEDRFSDLHADLAPKTGAMTELIDRTVETVRIISTELRPRLLDELGLIDALVWQTGEFRKRLGIPAELSVDEIEEPLPKDLATTVFRIFQELLTNVARHAEAERVDIELRARGTSLVLTVRDDGRGITPEEISRPESFGLLELTERAHLWGGQVHIGPAPEGGTEATVVLPIPDPSRQPDANAPG